MNTVVEAGFGVTFYGLAKGGQKVDKNSYLFAQIQYLCYQCVLTFVCENE